MKIKFITAVFLFVLQSNHAQELKTVIVVDSIKQKTVLAEKIISNQKEVLKADTDQQKEIARAQKRVERKSDDDQNDLERKQREIKRAQQKIDNKQRAIDR